jgi:hypothetical protein
MKNPVSMTGYMIPDLILFFILTQAYFGLVLYFWNGRPQDFPTYRQADFMIILGLIFTISYCLLLSVCKREDFDHH